MTLTAEPYVQAQTAVAIARIGSKRLLGFARVDTAGAGDYGFAYSARSLAGSGGELCVSIDPGREAEHEQSFRALVLFPDGLGVVGTTPEVSDYISRQLWFAAHAPAGRATAPELFSHRLLRGPDIHAEPAWQEVIDGVTVHRAPASARFAAYFPAEDEFGIAVRRPYFVRLSMVPAGELADASVRYTELNPFRPAERNGNIAAARHMVPITGPYRSVHEQALLDPSPEGMLAALQEAFEGRKRRVMKQERVSHVFCAAAAAWDPERRRWEGVLETEGRRASIEANEPEARDAARMLPKAYRDPGESDGIPF